jgi:hypothetical protein
MNVFCFAATGEEQYVKSVRSYWKDLIIREGDIKTDYPLGRGDVGRMWAGSEFQASDKDALLMLDMDMLHPSDLLEKLRAHNLDMVCAHYMIRTFKNMRSIITLIGDNKWPYPPLVDIPDTGLHEISMTGCGCALIKRNVYEAVDAYLQKIRPGDHPFAIGPLPEITNDWRPLGSDYRFFLIARHLGFKLWMDASIDIPHACTVWLTRDMYNQRRHDLNQDERLQMFIDEIKEKQGVNKKFFQLRIQQYEKRIEDYVGQAQRAQKSLDLLIKEINKAKFIVEEDKLLMEAAPEEEQGPIFPVVREEDKESALVERKEVTGYSIEKALLAREHQQQEEARGIVRDIQHAHGEDH